MTSTKMTKKEDWHKAKNPVMEIMSDELTTTLHEMDQKGELDELVSEVSYDGFRIDAKIQAQGTISLAAAQTPVDIEVSLFAEKSDRSGPIYHSSEDSSVELSTVEDIERIEEQAEQLLQQASERAIRALTRSLDKDGRLDVVHAFTKGIRKLKNNNEDSIEQNVPEPLMDFLSQTKGDDRIASTGSWHTRFVLESLNQIETGLLNDQTISGVTVEVDLPDEDEQFDWLSSAFGRYSYLSYCFNGPQGIVQKANSQNQERDARAELERAIDWEVERITQKVKERLSQNLERYYEYLDRETSFLAG